MSSTALSARKRALSSQDDMPENKRRRLPLPDAIKSHGEIARPNPSSIVTAHELARKGLRRGIALALDKVGFDAASEEAMESFAIMVETYLSNLVQDVKIFANASRRSYPIPTDFETSLKRFNLTPSALKPHLRPPVPRARRQPTWEISPAITKIDLILPILGDELSGAPEKESKQYIPKSFPSFPSIHTYKYTPEIAEAVTVSSDWDSFDQDLPSQTLSRGVSQSQSQSQSQSLPISQSQFQSQSRPLAPDEIPRGDPKKMREAAAKEAKAGEEALRRLMRASKIAKQKEVWTTAQRQPARRDRYDLWESAMRELLEDDALARGQSLAPGTTHGATGRFEIADHSMIVNAEGKYCRKEVPRAGGRKVGAGEMGLRKG